MKKLLAVLMAVCMLATVLAGCGSSSTAAPSSEPAASADAAGDKSDEVVTLTLVRTGTPEVLHEIFDPLIAEFETQHPNIKIDMQDLGWADAEKTLQTMSASRTLPDVMYHLPATIFSMYEKGLILDLTDYVDDDLKADMYPAMMEAAQVIISCLPLY